MFLINFYLFISYILYFTKIKNEEWWGSVTGYDTKDHNNGYAGSTRSKIIDFYLCGKRKYRVHYLGDDPLKWSENFSNCEPVGIGREIDGICVYGERSYKGRLQNGIQWLPVIKDCNISNTIVNKRVGYAGELGKPLSCVAINGKDKYRNAYILEHQTIKSSNPKNVSDRIIHSFFGNEIKNEAEYNKNYELNLSKNINNKNKLKFLNASVQLCKNEELNLNGDEIIFIFSGGKTDFSSWEKKNMNKLMLKKLKNEVNFDFNEEIKTFQNTMANDIIHGILSIHSFYEDNKIEFDIASKITKDFDGFRGGMKLNLILMNSDEFIELIKKVIIFISEYINFVKRKEVLNKLKDFKEIKELNDIMKLISPYDSLFTQIIVLYLLKR